MNGRIILGVLLVVVLIVGALGVGAYAYNLGVAQGLAQSDKLPAPPSGTVPYPYYAPFFFRPFGYGFGLLGCLFPLLFLFLIFALFRGMLWGGRWGWRRHHMIGDHDVPPAVEEWHRKMHESQTPNK